MIILKGNGSQSLLLPEAFLTFNIWFHSQSLFGEKHIIQTTNLLLRFERQTVPRLHWKAVPSNASMIHSQRALVTKCTSTQGNYGGKEPIRVILAASEILSFPSWLPLHFLCCGKCSQSPPALPAGCCTSAAQRAPEEVQRTVLSVWEKWPRQRCNANNSNKPPRLSVSAPTSQSGETLCTENQQENNHFHQCLPERNANKHTTSQSTVKPWGGRDYSISPRVLQVALRSGVFNFLSRRRCGYIWKIPFDVFFLLHWNWYNILQRPQRCGETGSCWHWGKNFILRVLHPSVCVLWCMCASESRTCRLWLRDDSTLLSLNHVFHSFFYAAPRLSMKRAVLIGDCFLCSFCSTSPHQEVTGNVCMCVYVTE